MFSTLYVLEYKVMNTATNTASGQGLPNITPQHPSLHESTGYLSGKQLQDLAHEVRDTQQQQALRPLKVLTATKS